MDQKESANAKRNDNMDDDDEGTATPNHHATITRNTTLVDSKMKDIVDDDDGDNDEASSWDCQAAPPTTPTTLTAKVTIGAQRVSGIYGHDSLTNSVEMADFEEYDTESVAAVATTTTATSYWQAQASLASAPSLISSISDGSSYLVEATTVPELVSARAIPMPPISEDGIQDDIDKESMHDHHHHTVIKSDGNLFCRQRRGLFLAIALLVVVIVSLALGVALGKDIPGNTTTANSSNDGNNNNNQNNSTTTRETGNSSNIFLHHAPTPSPTANNNIKIFLTTPNAQRCDSGYMFDITAKTNLDILALHINMKTLTTSQPIEVWTKSGPYHGFETNQSSWTLLAQTNVTPSSSMRSNNLVPLPRNLFSPISMTSGSQLALYVTARDKVICFQVSVKSLVGIVTYESVAYNTTDFDLYVGTGVSYRFDGFDRPSIWSGILEYERTGN